MIKLEDSSVLKLLPESILNDDIITAAKVIDTRFSKIVNKVDNITFYDDLMKLDDDVLEHLLHQHHITDQEGAALAITKEQKINLIMNSSYMHQIKGTSEAIEHVLRMLDMRGKVIEWFEYGGDPYYFRIDLVEVENRGLSQREQMLLMQLINAYKRKSAWLESIKLYLTTRTSSYHACATTIGLSHTVYPYTPGEILTEVSVVQAASTVVAMKSEIGGNK